MRSITKAEIMELDCSPQRPCRRGMVNGWWWWWWWWWWWVIGSIGPPSQLNRKSAKKIEKKLQFLRWTVTVLSILYDHWSSNDMIGQYVKVSSMTKTVQLFCYEIFIHGFFNMVFSRGHATLHLAVSVRPLVAPSVGPSLKFLKCERKLSNRPCQTVRDCPAVYPALFFTNPLHSQ